MSGYTAIVVGGGAAGLMAAYRLSDGGVKTVVLEAQERTGRKLCATGNGRCNLSNENVRPSSYGTAFAENCIRRYGYEYVQGVFDTIGIPYRTDAEGRAYPASFQASGVLDALRYAVLSRGGEIRENARVTAIGRERDKGFMVRIAGSSPIRCENVLIACGGCASPKLGGTRDGYRLAESLGHACTELAGGLAPLCVDPAQIRGLKGVRAPAHVSIEADGGTVCEKSGEVLFGNSALSGIVSMELSEAAEKLLKAGKDAYAAVSLIDGARGVLLRRIGLMPGRDAADILNGAVPRMLSVALAREAGVRRGIRAGDMTQREIESLASLAGRWRLRLTGTSGLEDAQITCGGLVTHSFDPETMMSKVVPGLFAAGEVLDVSGPCGGYNLHWAWASALCAADAVRERRV